MEQEGVTIPRDKRTAGKHMNPKRGALMQRKTRSQQSDGQTHVRKRNEDLGTKLSLITWMTRRRKISKAHMAQVNNPYLCTQHQPPRYLTTPLPW